MKIHIRTIHDGMKDYKCDTCGNLFTTCKNLKSHIRTVHEGRKDYECESCDEYFTQSAHLIKHIHSILVTASANALARRH